MSGLIRRGQFTHLGSERGGKQHVAAHHHHAAGDDPCNLAGEVHANQTYQHHASSRHSKVELAETVNELAKHQRHGTGHQQHQPQHKSVVLQHQVVLHVDDKIGEEHLHRNGEYAHACQRQVQRLMLADDGGAEAVDQLLQERGIAGMGLLLRHEEDAGKAGQRYQPAKDEEKALPVAGLRHGIKQAENDQHGQEGQNSQHAFHLAAVLIRNLISDVSVKGGVVGGGTKEGHHTVQNNHQHRRARYTGNGRQKPGGVFRRDKAKGRSAYAPQKIAHADKRLAAAYPVAERTHEQRGQRGRNGAGGNHGCNVGGVGGNGIVEEHIEVHVLNGPGKLAHQADEDHADPQAEGELFHE